MSSSLVRSARMVMLVAGVMVAASCDDTPTTFNTRDTDRLEVNPTFMVLPAGDTAKLDVRAVNAGAEPTFAAITATVTGCGPGAITVEDDPDQVDVQPPGQLLVIGGNTLGANCIGLSGDAATDTTDVIVVGNQLVVVSAEPSTLRAGGTGLYTVNLVAADGSSVTPFSAADVVFASDSAAIVAVDETGAYSTSQSGAATLSATWTGTEETGTDGLGVELVAEAVITVEPNVPTAVAFPVPPADSATGVVTFGGAAGEVFELEVLVLDDFGVPPDPDCPACPTGNQNTNPAEVTGVTAVSSVPGAATVVASLDSVFDPFTNELLEVHANLTIELIAAGATEITGSVETTVGTTVTVFPFVPISVFTFDPIVTSVGTGSGSFAEIVTITGSGLGQAGFETTVRANDLILGNFTVVSPTEITAQMPTFSTVQTLAIAVEIGGVTSDPVDWAMTTAFDEAATEPNQWSCGDLAGPASLPMIITGSLIGEPPDCFFGTMADWLAVTISRTVDVHITYDWENGDDKDFFVIDEGFNFFICQLATGDKPEDDDCELPGPEEGAPFTGVHHIIPEGFDEVDSNYTLSVTINED